MSLFDPEHLKNIKLEPAPDFWSQFQTQQPVDKTQGLQALPGYTPDPNRITNMPVNPSGPGANLPGMVTQAPPMTGYVPGSLGFNEMTQGIIGGPNQNPVYKRPSVTFVSPEQWNQMYGPGDPNAPPAGSTTARQPVAFNSSQQGLGNLALLGGVFGGGSAASAIGAKGGTIAERLLGRSNLASLGYPSHTSGVMGRALAKIRTPDGRQMSVPQEHLQEAIRRGAQQIG